MPATPGFNQPSHLISGFPCYEILQAEFTLWLHEIMALTGRAFAIKRKP
jgi:hypothetical protein